MRIAKDVCRRTLVTLHAVWQPSVPGGSRSEGPMLTRTLVAAWIAERSVLYLLQLERIGQSHLVFPLVDKLAKGCAGTG